MKSIAKMNVCRKLMVFFSLICVQAHADEILEKSDSLPPTLSAKSFYVSLGNVNFRYRNQAFDINKSLPVMTIGLSKKWNQINFGVETNFGQMAREQGIETLKLLLGYSLPTFASYFEIIPMIGWQWSSLSLHEYAEFPSDEPVSRTSFNQRTFLIDTSDFVFGIRALIKIPDPAKSKDSVFISLIQTVPNINSNVTTGNWQIVDGGTSKVSQWQFAVGINHCW